MSSIVLGIETSCDECSASVLQAEGEHFVPLSVSTFSQIEIHQPFGGVVPEVASRNHLEQIQIVIQAALDQAKLTVNDCDVIAVTNRPGLVGALLVGVTAAKALAYVAKKPLVAVHHLEGHLMSAFLSDAIAESKTEIKKIQFPAVFLMVSGGHTNIHLIPSAPAEWSKDVLKESLLGCSLDDAAGEAFDKTAKILGFPYPGGHHIDHHAKKGNREAFSLPRALKQKEGFDFSFSGLKTALMLLAQRLEKEGTLQASLNDVCASVQEAIIDPLIQRAVNAVRIHQAKTIVVVGGVAANSRLREKLLQESPVPVVFPNLKYCTDNAAMIAAAGAVRFHQGAALAPVDLLKLNAYAIS